MGRVSRTLQTPMLSAGIRQAASRLPVGSAASRRGCSHVRSRPPLRFLKVLSLFSQILPSRHPPLQVQRNLIVHISSNVLLPTLQLFSVVSTLTFLMWK